MSKKKRNVAIMFSGGFDSTYLLLKLLSENHNLNIKLIHVVSNALPGNKNYRESYAINDTIKYCSKLYSNAKLELIEINIGLDTKSMVKNLGFCQPMLWIPSALLYIDNNTDIYFGYNEDDEIAQFHQTDNVINAIKSLSSIINKKGISVKMPLLSTTKYEILYNLLDHYSKLFLSLTCCEYSNISKNNTDLYHKDCNCVPCVNLYNTLTNILEGEIIEHSSVTLLAETVIKYMKIRFPNKIKNRVNIYNKITEFDITM